MPQATMVTTESVAPWRVEIPMADLDIDEFVLWREQQRQKNVVETRKAMQQTACNYFWTRRLTGTDIISMITTTKPIGAGQLKEDIGPEWAEAKKSEKFLKKNVVNSKTPFDSASGMSAEAISEKEKQRINRGLWKEHKEFMEKLHRKRTQRARLEGYAVTRIQAMFRGWVVRQHWSALHAQLILRRVIRSDLRDLLSSNNLVLQGVEHRQKKTERRRRAAISIQCSYRRMLSYRALDRKRVIRHTERRRDAATRIQCLVRTWRSLMLTEKLRDRLRQERRNIAATRIQSVFRGSLGRKKHRVVIRLLQKEAATMIQCAYRQKRARQRVRIVRSTSQDKSREFGIKCIQRICRGFLGRQRFKRLRGEWREKRRASALLKLQTTARRWHACRRVAVRRARMKQMLRLWAILHVQRIVRGFVGRRRTYNKKLLLSINIWTQVRLGDDVLVEDIYTGVDTEQPLTPDTKDNLGNTLLILAARYGHLKIVRKCLQWEMKLNAMNQKGQTALHVAMAHRHAAVAEYLLSKPDAMISKSGRTLLHEAAKGGLHQCVLTLVNYGVDVDAVDPMSGRTALHEACKHGHASILRLLVKESSKSVNVQDKDGKTPLHWAAVRGSSECGQELVQAGATAKVVDSHGRPAIVYALLNGFEAMAKELESIWFSTKDIRVQEWTAADYGCALKLAETGLVVQLGKLLDLGLPVDGIIPPAAATPSSPKSKKHQQQQQHVVRQETVLLRAAKHGKKDVVAVAVQRGADVSNTTHPSSSLGPLPLPLFLQQTAILSVMDADGRSALHYAAANGEEGSKALDVNLRDKIGAFTPLHLAAASASPIGLKSMLSLGADVTALDTVNKRHALHTLAAASSSSSSSASPPQVAAMEMKECVLALLATPIAVNARDGNNATALVLAAMSGNVPVMEALLPKATPKERNEAVFAAVRAGRVSSLEVGTPEPSLRDDSAAGGGVTLLGCAIKEGRYEALAWVLSKGADPSVVAEASTGRSGLHLAAAYGTLRTLEAVMQSGKIKSLEEKDSAGYTALTWAILAHNYPVADALIKRGSLAKPTLQAGTWGWVLATVKLQERTSHKGQH